MVYRWSLNDHTELLSTLEIIGSKVKSRSGSEVESATDQIVVHFDSFLFLLAYAVKCSYSKCWLSQRSTTAAHEIRKLSIGSEFVSVFLPIQIRLSVLRVAQY